MAKIKGDEKRCFRFLQLDNKAQFTVCKIDALRGSGSDNHFVDELFETFEENSIPFSTFSLAFKKVFLIIG